MQLTLGELYSIKTLIFEGYSDSDIGRKIGRNRSVLSRLFKVCNRDAFDSEEVIRERAETKRRNSLAYCRIHQGGELRKYIDMQIRDGLSPEQVAGSWTKKTGEKLSKDTVYAFVYKDSPELTKLYLRRKGKKYRNRKQEQIQGKYQIGERRMIDDRPKEIEKRENIGDWEGDTIIGKDHKGAILTLVERKTGYLMAYKLEQGKNAVGVTSAIQKLWDTTPLEKRKTLTFDNGREFADHKMLEYFIKTLIYFAHPYHSWERGTNENTNGLLRVIYPKENRLQHNYTRTAGYLRKKDKLKTKKKTQVFYPLGNVPGSLLRFSLEFKY